MKFLEFIIALSLIAILFSMVSAKSNHSLELAHSTLLSHLKYLQILSLSDNGAFTQNKSAQALLQEYPSIDSQKFIAQHKQSMWQCQFHLGKLYTTSSYSLYSDTPRFSTSTNFDSRPMAGDFIVKSLDGKCLSGYNNTNTSPECKNNLLAEVRLGERFGIDKILLEMDGFCIERETARIYFDHFGQAYCGKIPTRIQKTFKITLLKHAQQKSICILPSGIVQACA